MRYLQRFPGTCAIPAALFLLALAGRLEAQTPFEEARLSLRSSGVEEGLPSATVQSLMLDSRGFLWAGGPEGPGYLAEPTWTAVTMPREARSTYVRAMVQVRDGSTWFGTQEGGLWRLARGAWTHFGKEEGVPANRVNCLLETADGLWAGTWGAGVLRFDGQRWVDANPPPEVMGREVWRLREFKAPDGTPEMWVASQKGIAVRRAGGWRRMGPGDGFRDGTSVNDIIEMPGPGGTRTVWASCWGSGVARWDGRAWRYWGPAEGFPSLNPTCLGASEDAGGGSTLWVGTFDKGLCWLQDGVWSRLPPGVEDSITGIYALLVNPLGRPRLWIGTRGHGVVAVDPAGWRTLDRAWGLPSSDANCFLETAGPGGRPVFWFGTDRGIARWEEGRIRVETTADGLPHDWVADLKELGGPGQPEVWAATLNGVARRVGGKWRTYTTRDGLPSSHGRCLLPAREDDGSWSLFAGFEAGLARFKDGRWEDLGQPLGLPPPVVHALHRSLDADGKTSLWAGFRGKGVGRFREGQWTVYGEASGLPVLSVFSIVETRHEGGRRWIWAATLGGGLARLNPDLPGARWEVFDSRRLPDLPSNNITRIEPDLEGGLYLTTARGIARVQLAGPDGDPRSVVRYYSSDGLPAAATNLGATYLDSRGRVWVGTAKGVAVLDRRLETLPRRVERPVLDRVRADGFTVESSTPLFFGHARRRLSFQFGLPFYFRREDIRYRSQVEGLEPEPGEWRRESAREFTALPPGRFVLKVWARDFQGEVPNTLEVPFTIEAPPWKRWWAYLLYASAIAAAAAALLTVRERLLKERARNLEALVDARTHELARANEALRELSLTDPLTGLSNRRFIDVFTQDEAARILRRCSDEAGLPRDQRTANRHLAFLLLDLDYFKVVNDEHGHHAGDLALQQTANILRGLVREGDHVVRWGGEEFLVVAQDVEPGEISLLAERIRAAIEAHPFDLGLGQPVRQTCSVGLACFPVLLEEPARFSWEQALELADQCLYEAKTGGRNRWVGIGPRTGAAPGPDSSTATLSARELARLGLVDWRQGPDRPSPPAA